LIQCEVKSTVYASKMLVNIRENITVMNTKLVTIVLSFLTLCACASQSPTNTQTSSDVALAEASYSVSRSIVNLSEVAQSARPLPAMDPPPNPASYGMNGITSIDWSGPAEQLVKQLADSSNYRLRVLGARPAIPVLVTVYSKNIMVADALRDVGYQCGRRATVVIFPDSRVVELRYAKN
jgi:defect-in-organelle-trafficking protein DotD